MGRVFQGASTVDAILRPGLLERAAEAGMRSVFVGLETINPTNLALHAKRQNLARDYEAAIRRVHDLGIMVNASFVFGLDDDGPDVFDRTVDWAVSQSIETATFHIMTPYPGTTLHDRVVAEGRVTDTDWDHYDTRHVVYRPKRHDPRRAARRLPAGPTATSTRWGSILRGAAGQADPSSAGPPPGLRRWLEAPRTPLGHRSSARAGSTRCSPSSRRPSTRSGGPAWHVGLEPDVSVSLATGHVAVAPDRLSRLGAKGLAKSGDRRLLKAIALLGSQTPPSR